MSLIATITPKASVKRVRLPVRGLSSRLAPAIGLRIIIMTTNQITKKPVPRNIYGSESAKWRRTRVRQVASCPSSRKWKRVGDSTYNCGNEAVSPPHAAARACNIARPGNIARIGRKRAAP